MTNEVAVPAETRRYQGRTAGLVSRCLAAAADAVVVLPVPIAVYWTVVRLLVRRTQFPFPDPSLVLPITVGIGLAVLRLASTELPYPCVADRRAGRAVQRRERGRPSLAPAGVHASDVTLIGQRDR